MTFDIRSSIPRGNDTYESFVRCRFCGKGSILEIYNGHTTQKPSEFNGQYVDGVFRINKVVLSIPKGVEAPEYVPSDIKAIFDEAAICMAVQCFDASGSMFRKVLDSATRNLLPPQPNPEDKSHEDYISWKTRKDLGLRLDWLFDKKVLPLALRELATCVREDGNDAAHSATGITKEEAQDLQDFTIILLESVFTVPGQIEANKKRRTERRASNTK